MSPIALRREQAEASMSAGFFKDLEQGPHETGSTGVFPVEKKPFGEVLQEVLDLIGSLATSFSLTA